MLVITCSAVFDGVQLLLSSPRKVCPPTSAQVRKVCLSVRQGKYRQVGGFIKKGAPLAERSLADTDTHSSGCHIECVFSPLLDHLHGGIPRTALCASATQPRTCQDAAMSERVICRNVEVEAEMSGTRSPLRASVRAVSSATGVGNKVRLLHGHHTFPNPLQT